MSGIVVHEGQATPIPGAVVRLSAGRSTLTDGAGRFRLGGVTPGSYTASVEAYGYVAASRAVVIRSDTTLRFELAADPVALDSILVSGTSVTIKGNLRDATDGLRIYPATQVTIYPGGRTVGGLNGSFTLPGLPRGRMITLVVQAFEYLPFRVELSPDRDTTLDVSMSIDSVALRMIAEQVRRIEVRAQAVPYASRELDRETIRLSGALTVGALLARQFPGGVLPRQCIFIDDMQYRIEDVLILPPGAIERIEIFGLRGRMLRVYTRKYVARLMRVPRLTSILYAEGLGAPVCR